MGTETLSGQDRAFRCGECAEFCSDEAHPGDSVDLMFTDVLVPGGMSGVELARPLRGRYPSLPVLLTTGYSGAVQEGGNGRVSDSDQAYRPSALQAQIRDLLLPARRAQA